jgi:elongation factor P
VPVAGRTPVVDCPRAPKMLAPGRKISMVRATIPAEGDRSTARLAARPVIDRGIASVKVIASSLRKGNIVDLEGRLYVILTAENIHPGKGTPVTQLDMRRLSDGVKSSQRYKTTDQVERALVEEREFQFLYQDGDGFHFMNMENYDQIAVPEDVIGDQAKYLHPEMKVKLSVHEGVAVGIVLPPRVTLEVTETEPTTKGQTASSSYKPALLSNGVRTTVPPHIVAGTRIVVSTEDGSYVERAKD